MSCTAGYTLLDHRRNEDTLEIKVDTVEEKCSQYKQTLLNRSVEWKTSDTQNNSLTIDTSEDLSQETGHLLASLLG
jgi:hypothetical protein